MVQKFNERISDIIESKIDGVKSVKEQIIFASKKMTVAFWEANHFWEPQLGSTKARNIFNGEEKEIDEILGEFLSMYKLD
jgi:hypothetical protein